MGLYNRYIGNTGKFYRVSENHQKEESTNQNTPIDEGGGKKHDTPPRRASAVQNEPRRSKQDTLDSANPAKPNADHIPHKAARQNEHTPDDEHRDRNPKFSENKKKTSLLGNLSGIGETFGGSLKDTIKSFLPAGIDTGDILLLLLLLFLYLESNDEEFLIILIIVGFNIFKSMKEQPCHREV